MFKKLIALLKDKPRLYEIVFGSETPTARKFDLMVIIAISVSLIVMFVESLHNRRVPNCILYGRLSPSFVLLTSKA